MTEIFLFFIITGPLGEREIPIKRFVDYSTCQAHINNHLAEEITRYPFSIGQNLKAVACKEKV